MDSLLDHSFLFITGKGGTGKSTVSAALALQAARAGHQVLLYEVGSQHRSDTLLEQADTGTGSIHCQTIDPQVALEAYLSGELHSKTLSRMLVKNRLFSYLASAAPGLNEIATLSSVWEAVEGSYAGDYDLVILDAPASGHGMAMFAAPSTYRTIARSGPVEKRARLIESMLYADSTQIIITTLAAETPVNETLDLVDKFAALGKYVEVVLGAVREPNFSRNREREMEEALTRAKHPATSTVLEALLVEENQAWDQRAQVRRLRGELAGAPLYQIDYLEGGVDGVEGLEALIDTWEIISE